MIKQAYLDSVLQNTTPENFDSTIQDLIRDFGTADLEIKDPESWRTPKAEKHKLSNQFENEISTILPLSKDEEILLAKKLDFTKARLSAAKTESEAEKRKIELEYLRFEMIERSLYLVPIYARRFRHNSLKSDLLQEGSISLYKAVDSFDWRKGYRFQTYAQHKIIAAIRYFLHGNKTNIRIPVYLQKAYQIINRIKLQLGIPNASAEELSRISSLDIGIVERVLKMRDEGSLDIEDAGGKPELLRNKIASPEEEPKTDLSALFESMNTLNEREKQIINYRYGIGLEREFTLQEIASVFQISLQRVQQIQIRAMEKMKEKMAETGCVSVV